MDENLFRTVMLRVIIEHRFVRSYRTMAQAIKMVATDSGLTPRYVNMLLMGDRSSPEALDQIEDAITRLSDVRGGVPSVCCSSDSLEHVRETLAYHRRGGGE